MNDLKITRSYITLSLAIVLLTPMCAVADTLLVPAEYPTIQAAVDAAATNGDDVLVSPGTYVGSGTEVVNMRGKSVMLHSADGPEVTFIDAENSRRGIVCVSGEGPDTIVEGFTIRNGFHATTGGGMYNSSSSPTITRCVFANNVATGGGGGMRNENASPLVTDCTFIANRTTGTRAFGGGMLSEPNASPVVTDCLFVQNRVSGDRSEGGGFDSRRGGSPIVTRCEFRNNVANTAGGGWSCIDGSPVATDCLFVDNWISNDESWCGGMYNVRCNATITDCVFIRNVALGKSWGYGAGMWNSSGSAVITRCHFEDNAATTRGGGMIIGGDSITIRDCTFVGNSVTDREGGGAMHCADTSISLEISDCSFSGNSSQLHGGAIYLASTDATIERCIFDENTSALDGGAIFSRSSDTTIRECTFRDNVADRGGGLFSEAGAVVISRTTFCGNAPQNITGAVTLRGRQNCIGDGCCGSGPVLTVESSCPLSGAAQLTAAGGSGGTVVFVSSVRRKATIIPDPYPCAGVSLDIGSRLNFIGTAIGDPAIFDIPHVDAEACGTLKIQAIDVSTCTTSNVVVFRE